MNIDTTQMYYLFLLFIFGAGNSTTEMVRGYGSGSGRINFENEGGYGLELVDSAGGGYVSGSGSGGVGKKNFHNWISFFAYFVLNASNVS